MEQYVSTNAGGSCNVYGLDTFLFGSVLALTDV